MNEAQQARCLELGRRGYSVEMIYRMVRTEMDLRQHRSAIKELLNNAGISTKRDSPPEHMELQNWEDDEALRKRWAQRLPGMKEKLRTEAKMRRGWR
jgi:hypothetical protein